MSEDFKVPGLNYEVTPSPYSGGSVVENPGLDELRRLREQAALAYENENPETPKTPENTIDTQLGFLKPPETKEKNPVKEIANITEKIAELRRAYQEFNQAA